MLKPTAAQVRQLTRLGRVPREVFELMVEADQPIKPYDLLWRLQTRRGRPAPPTTVYRALAVLAAAGLVHRIGSLGVYARCTHPRGAHEPAFLICEACNGVSEVNVEGMSAKLVIVLKSTGFKSNNFELCVRGICRACQDSASH